MSLCRSPCRRYSQETTQSPLWWLLLYQVKEEEKEEGKEVEKESKEEDNREVVVLRVPRICCARNLVANIIPTRLV